jgi:hypothetical protein
MRSCAVGCLVLLAVARVGSSHVTPSVDAFVAALRPALPFPAATADTELPDQHGTSSKWFVVWPDPETPRVVVKANPLHPDVQDAGAAAMGRIQEAIVAADRKAQAAYDHALEELRRTGNASDLEGISLDDEGIAGEQIDAELALNIELQRGAESFDIASSEAPAIKAGTNGIAWVVSVAANSYRAKSGPDMREHFTAAESRLYFGAVPRPTVDRLESEPRFRVTISPIAGAFAVVLRGNQDLLQRVVATADWSQLLR